MRKVFQKVKRGFYTYLAWLKSRNRSVLSVHVNNYCIFTKKTFFGNNVHFNGCKIYGKGIVSFGDNFHSAENLRILTTFHNYRGNKIPYDDTYITKDVKIEDNVWIGIDVIILGGVTIGEGAIIQAGSVVSKSIPALGIAGGNPARVFNQRDKEKYNSLKINRKFF